MTASEAARRFEQVARGHGLRETGHYDPKLVDMLTVRLRQTRKEERHTTRRQASRIIYASVLSGELLGIKRDIGTLSR